MTDTEIIERYFKARGWNRIHKNDMPHNDILSLDWHWCSNPKDIISGMVIDELPKILTDFPAFKEHVLGVMGEEGWEMSVTVYQYSDGPRDNDVEWWCEGQTTVYCETVKDNNILHAAVIGATRFWEGEE